MQFFLRLPIKHKLMWIIMGISGVALTLMGVSLAVNDLFAGKRSLLERLATQADIVGANSTAALAFNDPLAAEEILAALRAESVIVAAAIYSQDHELFAYYLSDSADRSLVPQQLRRPIVEVTANYVQVARPITLKNKLIGMVYLRADLRELYSRFGSEIGIIALTLIASSAIAWLLSSKLQSTISKPILQLAETAKVISCSKNYAIRVEKQNYDELGLLIQAFNEMLSEIQDSGQKLEQHRAELEKLVTIRTAELHTANQQLTDQAHRLEELVSLRTAELHKLNEQLKHEAYHDPLTDLPNRALLNDRLSQEILHAQRHEQALAVMFLDLDRFKVINDTLGHAVGDELLRMAAERLKKLVRRDDTVARLGGDEFTILLSNMLHADDAARIAGKIVEGIQMPFDCCSHELHLSTSIGIAVFPKDGTDSGTLMRNADTAMYCAKQEGRGNYRFYSADMHTAALERLAMENRLRRALTRNEFVVHYQPQFDIHSGQVIAVEALVRWNDPQLGLVAPSTFIPFLEETGLIVAVGEWVLRNACMEIKRCIKRSAYPLGLAVNFSSRQFSQRSVAQTVHQIVSESELEPARLTLEITESILMQNTEEILETLHAISRMGVNLAIDDFGTGYSSLSYLKRLPIRTVKIDKSFVHDITTNPDSAAIVKATIAMAHNLNLKVTAEGVETNEQLAFLRLQQCDAVQGYLLGQPAPIADI